MGPGPSKTTLNTVPNAVAAGSSVEITGSVLDQTPQKQLFNTPCVADSDQGPQMEYLIQHSIDAPSNLHGVTVQLFATDSSGATTQIASITSEAVSGMFHYMWSPSKAGEYVITANFPGSQAYGPSSDQTAIAVVTAPAASVTPSPTPPVTVTPTPSGVTPTPTSSIAPTVAPTPTTGFPATDLYIIAAAIVIIIIVAVAAVALRRRK